MLQSQELKADNQLYAKIMRLNNQDQIIPPNSGQLNLTNDIKIYDERAHEKNVKHFNNFRH